MRLRALALASVALVSSLGGCARSCKNDHPYVPYAVGDAPSASASADPPGSALATAPLDAGATSAEPALVAPPHATTWKVEDVELRAPDGTELVLAIVRDFDGDGRKDALAVARRPAAEGKAHEVGPASIVAYVGGGPPRTVATAPDPRVDPACAPVARLERVGPRSAYAEVGSACTSGPAERAAWVVRLDKAPSVAFDLAVHDPPGAPKLTLDVDGADRDRDGIDDVALRVTIEGGSPPMEPGPRLTGKLAFFDRPAGASRDPDEPEASLHAIASVAAARAKQPREAPTVPVLVAQLRSLYRAMCREGGAPRLVRRGDGIPCGAGKSLEDAGVAEVRALVSMGDPLRAALAADRVELPPATKTAARTTELAQLLAQAAPYASVPAMRMLTVTVPPKVGPHPEWGPLAFEPSGKLLVRAEAKVVRVDPLTGDQEDTDLPPWPSQVLSPDGKSRLLEVYHACEGVSLRATFAPTGADGDVKDVLVPVAPPLGVRCAGARGEPASVVPLAFGARGLEAVVAGQPLLFSPDLARATLLSSMLDEPGPPGSPRSAGGKALAIPTGQGVLVRAQKTARYKLPELEPYDDVRQCAVSDDATRLACTRHGRVFTTTLPPP
jgi:hypothetical protein